jgi:hypothetical protein
MTWKIYSGEPFEGERIFKFGSKFGIADFGTLKYYLESDWVKTAFYLDESESFSIEDMRDAYLNGFDHAERFYEPQFFEWLKGREGK